MTLNGPEKRWCAALGLLLSLTMSARAHAGDRVYPISYLTDEVPE